MQPKRGNILGIQGFTLIELSVVLVIIGLIAGSILVGQDLIRAASIRAQITQIEKYNHAVNTFRGKYNALPGDLNAQVATQFGFSPRGGLQGQGDGNGYIEGADGLYPWAGKQLSGESVMLWVDLTTANGLKLNLIDGSFNTASSTVVPTQVMGTIIPAMLPAAKIGRGSYVYSWNGGITNGVNYWGVCPITTLSGGSNDPDGTPGFTVYEAYQIDKKTDDGLPQSGNVIATYDVQVGPPWASGNKPTPGAYDPTTLGAVVAGDGVATSPSSITCYDNGGVAGATEQYSLSISNGANVNCALSFKFQ